MAKKVKAKKEPIQFEEEFENQSINALTRWKKQGFTHYYKCHGKIQGFKSLEDAMRWGGEHFHKGNRMWADDLKVIPADNNDFLLETMKELQNHMIDVCFEIDFLRKFVIYYYLETDDNPNLYVNDITDDCLFEYMSQNVPRIGEVVYHKFITQNDAGENEILISSYIIKNVKMIVMDSDVYNFGDSQIEYVVIISPFKENERKVRFEKVGN